MALSVLDATTGAVLNGPTFALPQTQINKLVAIGDAIVISAHALASGDYIVAAMTTDQAWEPSSTVAATNRALLARYNANGTYLWSKVRRTSGGSD